MRPHSPTTSPGSLRVSRVMFGLGGVALLVGMGGLLGFFGMTDAEQAPPLSEVLIALLVAAALIGGATAIRAGVSRRLVYRVTKPFDVVGSVVVWGGLAGLFAIVYVIGFALHTRASIGLIAAWPALMLWHHKRMTALQVDISGLNLGGAAVRWADLAQLAVADSGVGGQVRIGAWLRPGRSPAAGIVPNGDPRSAAPIQVAVQRHKFDLARLTAMVGQYAPRDVRIIPIDHLTPQPSHAPPNPASPTLQGVVRQRRGR